MPIVDTFGRTRMAVLYLLMPFYETCAQSSLRNHEMLNKDTYGGGEVINI